MNKRTLIGFIGQGWIGQNYANDFENRGFDVVRYALEDPYINNKEKIKDCDMVFIAVPTPTTIDGFDYSIVDNALSLIGEGKIAVIKSTILPKTTEGLQKNHPQVFVLHSPEFLTEATAAHDAANPNRNIIGLPVMNDEYKEKAREVLAVLPKASFEQICSAREAELVKYAGNIFLYFKVIFANIFYDYASTANARWDEIKDAVGADPRIGKSHLHPIHQSGRGAGGHCFIKDFAAFREIYEKEVGDKHGVAALKALEEKNIALLINSEKNLDLLSGVYGEKVFEKNLL